MIVDFPSIFSSYSYRRHEGRAFGGWITGLYCHLKPGTWVWL